MWLGMRPLKPNGNGPSWNQVKASPVSRRNGALSCGVAGTICRQRRPFCFRQLQGWWRNTGTERRGPTNEILQRVRKRGSKKKRVGSFGSSSCSGFLPESFGGPDRNPPLPLKHLEEIRMGTGAQKPPEMMAGTPDVRNGKSYGKQKTKSWPNMDAGSAASRGTILRGSPQGHADSGNDQDRNRQTGPSRFRRGRALRRLAQR